MSVITKTASRKWSGTVNNVDITLCDEKQTCCTSTLDNVGRDREQGSIDRYNDPNLLGDCVNAQLEGSLTATISKNKTDGWRVEWVQVTLARSRTYFCEFNRWIDPDGTKTARVSQKCNKGNIVLDEHNELISIYSSFGSD